MTYSKAMVSQEVFILRLEEAEGNDLFKVRNTHQGAVQTIDYGGGQENSANRAGRVSS